ncbi:uncharacterized protein CEXT_14171 [Caerostris extrusa]|uniref:Uncharacterized protein n=1 Tax=Caerostris extrusa TaxID=172846 RepID=A0AAV4VMB3_CAEEX|nr:uncharacterized protein CEXT_14171 [Caerostris extrusa]
MFAKVVIFCAALAAAHASVVGTYGLGAPILAAGPLGIGKGLIGAVPVVATVSSQRTAINHVAPAAAIGAAAPIALANGLVGNGLIANGLSPTVTEFSPTESSLETESSPTDSLPDTESPHPLAIGNGLLGAPTVSESERSVLQPLLDSDSVLERLFINYLYIVCETF